MIDEGGVDGCEEAGCERGGEWTGEDGFGQ